MKFYMIGRNWILYLLLMATPGVYAQSTHIQYLSGTGKDDTVDWDFFCTKGRASGEWTSIAVPSCWEQEGFGTYNYGRDGDKADEQGFYKHSFTIPVDWSDKNVFIVFEGSMTDTEVKINGHSAGNMHQGAFYRFQYDISELLEFGEENLLEVTVSKMSANQYVNDAERRSDFWVFGGIYRPVYLKVLPQEYIDRTAIVADADGSFSVDVYLSNITMADNVKAQIRKLDGTPVGGAFSESIQSAQDKITLSTSVEQPLTWNAETPQLYQLVISLEKDDEVLHQVIERFGFRTIEVKSGDGIYVNGEKIMFKGTNRHSFHPETGRTLNEDLSVMDVTLMKEMNMNAVRMSHYPPDAHFLDVCDELGLYVLNELTGWQDAYDTPVGEILVEELVVRDINHPSVIFWCNGNEGGWNTELDDDFSKWDPQQRPVLHPWATFSDIDTDHYERYNSVKNKLDGTNIFLPTELIHGMYDGGHGAGLNDYWRLMMSSPLSAGAFTWTFLDEGVKRTDTDEIDVKGNFAPDGIVGPYREKEASFYTVKEIWSPVYIERDELEEKFTTVIPVENRYSFTNLNQCQFEWKLVDYYLPALKETGFQIIHKGSIAGPDVSPGSAGKLVLDLPEGWEDRDAILITAKDHANREIYTWTWSLQNAKTMKEGIVVLEEGSVSSLEESSCIIIQAGNHEFRFDKRNGELNSVSHNGHQFGFTNGPILCSGSQSMKSISVRQEGDDQIVEVIYEGDMKLARWRINASGWIQLHYEYELNGSYDFLGVGFAYPEEYVRSVKWLGKGPFRVYKNRMKGVNHNVWQKDYNKTITGQTGWEYPEFKGYHADVNWAVLETVEGTMTMVSEEDDLFLHMFTPETPIDPRNAWTPYPKSAISFLDGIPAIGTKFMVPDKMGPESQLNVASGSYSHTLNFYFDTDRHDP